MNLNEKEKLYKWASEAGINGNFCSCFTQIEDKCDSYYVKRNDNNTYMREYDFETVPEIKEELYAMWGNDADMQKIITTVLVSAIKNKPVFLEDKGKSPKCALEDNKKELKPYIYNF